MVSGLGIRRRYMQYSGLTRGKIVTKFQVSIIVNQPVEMVVKALLNQNNHIYWTKDLVKFELIKGQPGEVGSMGNLHYSQKGQTYVMKDELIYCEPGRKYVSQISRRKMINQSKLELETFKKLVETKGSNFGG